MEKEKKHQRTHIPVEGYKIEDLKLLDLEENFVGKSLFLRF